MIQTYLKTYEIPDGIINCKIRKFPLKQHVEEHCHDFFEIMYVVHGTINHKFNSQNNILREGDFVLIDIGDIHSYSASDDFEIIDLLFTPQIIDSSTENCKNLHDLLKNSYFHTQKDDRILYTQKNNVMNDKNREIYNLILSIMSDIKQPKTLSPLIIKYCIISIILKTLQSTQNKIESINLSNSTKKILKLIETNYNDDNLLVYAAETLNYSLPHLSRTFKKELGTSFKEYLQKYRINEAKTLLFWTNKNITEISIMVGYKSPKYFTALFKKYTNFTPSDYKKFIRKNQ